MRDVRYDLVWILPDGGTLSLVPALTDLTWEEQPGELAMRCSFRVRDKLSTRGMLHELLSLGGFCSLQADVGSGFQEINQFVAFEREYDDNGLVLPGITAYDRLVYLMKSEYEKIYLLATSAKNIILDLFGIFSLKVGSVDGPDVLMPARFEVHGSLAATVNDVLRRAFMDSDDSEFFPRMRSSVVDVVQPGQNETKYHFSSALNVSGFKENESISNLVTEVQIASARGQMLTGSDPADRAPAPLAASIIGPHPEFGRLIAVVKGQENDTRDTLETNAQLILAEKGEPTRVRTIPCPDMPFVRKGDMHVFRVGTLDGSYVVTGVVHNATTKTMSVTIDSSGTLARRVRSVKTQQRTQLSDEPGVKAGL